MDRSAVPSDECFALFVGHHRWSTFRRKRRVRLRFKLAGECRADSVESGGVVLALVPSWNTSASR